MENENQVVSEIAETPAAGQENATLSEVSPESSVSTDGEKTEVTEPVAPVVSEEPKDVVTEAQVTEPSPENSQFANPESEPSPEFPEPIKIHPLDFGLLMEKAASENPDATVNVEIVGEADDKREIIYFNGNRYIQTIEVPASDEAVDHFNKQMAIYAAEKRRNSIAGVREELDALKAEVEELKARIDDHNARSGHKI